MERTQLLAEGLLVADPELLGLQRLAGASPDAREGIAAFLEKRAPKYTGRKG